MTEEVTVPAIKPFCSHPGLLVWLLLGRSETQQAQQPLIPAHTHTGEPGHTAWDSPTLLKTEARAKNVSNFFRIFTRHVFELEQVSQSPPGLFATTRTESSLVGIAAETQFGVSFLWREEYSICIRCLLLLWDFLSGITPIVSLPFLLGIRTRDCS